MTNVQPLAPDDLGPTVCVGEILVEIVATSVGEGFLEPIDLIGPYPSGAPAIFIDQCARMGGSAAMVATVGNDDFGRLNTLRLEGDGADVSAISLDPELPTGSAFVRYRSDGSRDFVYNMWTSAAGQLRWTDAVDALVNRSGHLHIMGTLLSRPAIWEIIDRAAGIIKSRGGSLSLDPNLRKELKNDDETELRFAKVVEMSDLLLPSGEELERAAGVSGEDAALCKLFGLGVGEVVLKRGAGGATFFGKDGCRIDSPAFLVDELDPTGAGDCFGGAYVACRRLGMTIDDALTYANAAGARNVTVRGPMEGAGTRTQLDQFITDTMRRA
ncbi:sugar kinase [Mesorhizobium sp. AaZ16]|uniref:tagatose kinase n=1 Tax=Mesorhizobium sp. AaZ16 TaxID=3402289 RepID=UPI00374F1F77